MKPSSDRPSSPKYSVSNPSRIGQPNIKISKKDKQRTFSADKELYSFYVINPSYDLGSTEQRDDKSVQFMFVGRPDIEEGDVQGRHIHAFALFKEAIYSTLENIDILDVPNALHRFLEHHKHCYATTDEKKDAYDKRVSGFIYQTIDDDSCSSRACTRGVVENTNQSQRIHAETLDERMFSYFDKRYNDILSSRGISYRVIDLDFLCDSCQPHLSSQDQEIVRKMSDLTLDEREVVSIYNSFIERRNFLSAQDIRSNMKDAEYISICSRMNRMVSEAIEIVNGMPGVTFHHGKSKGSGEKNAMRRLREQNALPGEKQDLSVIAPNMAKLIDFPVAYFHDKENYSLKEVLENHIELVKTAFPGIAVDDKVIRDFLDEFNKRDLVDIKDDVTGPLLDEGSWNYFVNLDVLLNDILCSDPKTAPYIAQATKVANVVAIGQNK